MIRNVLGVALAVALSACSGSVKLYTPSFEVSPEVVELTPARYDQPASSLPHARFSILNTSEFPIAISDMKIAGSIAPLFNLPEAVRAEVLSPRTSLDFDLALLAPTRVPFGLWTQGEKTGTFDFSVTARRILEDDEEVDRSRLPAIETSLPIKIHLVCDHDGDGALAPECGGDDCDDFHAEIHPGADEICDGVDNNCADGIQDEAC